MLHKKNKSWKYRSFPIVFNNKTYDSHSEIVGHSSLSSHANGKLMANIMRQRIMKQ